MKKKILVVEDEMIVAMDLQVTLIDLGYEVPAILTSGTDALAQAAELQPDLVLMDINLGDSIDGITVAAQIIQDLAIPVVYLTAYADDKTLERARQTAPFGYILKPFEARELKANLEIALYKHRLEQIAQADRQWLLAVLNSISEAVIASDHDGQIKFMNPVAEQLTGWPQAEAIYHSPAEVINLIDSLTGQPIENPLLQALHSGEKITLYDHALLRNRQGHETPVADSAAPITDGRGRPQGAVMVFRDVTEQKRSQAQMEHSALYDALTDLPNRVLFLDRLQQAVERVKRQPGYCFALMLLDLDRFKAINDTLGHLLGDELLVAVAPRFKAHMRRVDTVARFGGDEFAILLENVSDVALACQTAERILMELKHPFQIGGNILLVNASIGIVMSTIPHTQAVDLLKDADIAMYRAKAQGRGCYKVFDATMHRRAKTAMQLEQDLRQAIAHQHLQAHYQPIVCLQSQRVVSLEALVRWPTAAGELISPAEFIPIAEEVGLVSAIDQWMLTTACQQLQKWRQKFGARGWQMTPGGYLSLSQTDTSLPLTMSVNLSSKQFSQQHLVDRFTTALRQSHLTGSALKLEVTESVFIENAEAAVTILTELQELGVQICLDDFGTGYSSLSYLYKFPIDIVKIDRSFIQGLETDREKLEIVRAILELCHTLGMAVTAEGIETPEQQRLLSDLGCEYGQGYLLLPPLSEATLNEYLTASS